MNSISQIIKGAGERLANPDGWIQRALYHSKAGVKIDYLSTATIDLADRVCTVGAILGQMPDGEAHSLFNGMYWDSKEPMHTIHRLLKQAVTELYGTPIASIITWQDNPYRTQVEVVAMFERAYELALAAEEEASWKIPALTASEIDEAVATVTDVFVAPVAVDPQLLLVP